MNNKFLGVVKIIFKEIELHSIPKEYLFCECKLVVLTDLFIFNKYQSEIGKDNKSKINYMRQEKKGDNE